MSAATAHEAAATGAPMAAPQAAAERPFLQMVNVSRRFGSLKAVDDVSFDMAAGELRAVIGPNGAGKTTFFNLISGLLPPSQGRVIFDGEDITRRSVAHRVAKGIVRTFQITEILPDLSVFENIRIGVETARGINARPWIGRGERIAVNRRIEELIAIVNLTDKARRIVGELAHGDQRVVEVAVALSVGPRLLLLDEPTAGMGDQETYEIIQLIRRLHKDNKLTIVLIEHDMRVVFHLADRIMVLDQGKFLAEGTPPEIAANTDVQTAYLGQAA